MGMAEKKEPPWPRRGSPFLSDEHRRSAARDHHTVAIGFRVRRISDDGVDDLRGQIGIGDVGYGSCVNVERRRDINTFGPTLGVALSL